MSKPKLHECSFTFTEDEPNQAITVSVEDQGSGPYWVIQTDSWAIDDIDEFVNLFAEVVQFTKDSME